MMNLLKREHIGLLFSRIRFPKITLIFYVNRQLGSYQSHLSWQGQA